MPLQMNKLICVLFFLFCLNAQAKDFEAVDAKVKAYPKAFTSVDRLASRISKDFPKEEDKARAIFTWIASNIRYDVPKSQKVTNMEMYSLPEEEQALKILIAKKGICQDYSTLYKVLAEKVGLEAVIISGFGKTLISDVGKLASISDHAWNAVKIAGEWKLIDVTWGAGSVTQELNGKFSFDFRDEYFFTPPDLFFLKHYPEDKKWLLANKKIEDFIALPLYHDITVEIISPVKGILYRSKNKTVDFAVRLKNIDDEVSYAFDTDEYGTVVDAEIKDGVVHFSVQLTSDKSREFTIYIDQDAAVSYKIDK